MFYKFDLISNDMTRLIHLPISVSCWEERNLLNSTDSLTLDGSDSDVALFTPSCSPGVSDNVVVLTVLSSKTNSSDSVIKLSSTFL